jgi:peptidyl-prolyl cis-trans isomerase SurA
MAPLAPDAAEVADRQTQAGPLGLAGDTSKKKKKKSTTTGDKTRLADKKKSETPAQNSGDVPLGPAPQTPAPAPAPQTPAPAPQN